MRNRCGLTLGILLSLALVLSASAGKDKSGRNAFSRDGLKWGEHNGEVKQLAVNVEFKEYYGQTLTDENGTTYCVFGNLYYENKVYPPEYWGVFPLYFFGLPTVADISITNLGPRNRAWLRISTEAYCLRTDGSNGAKIGPDSEAEVDLEPGETETARVSFTSEYTEGAESGLDRLLIKVAHPNNGGGPGNSDPALIMLKEAIFCPPENEGEILEILEQILAE